MITVVKAPVKVVSANFNRKLFEFLLPRCIPIVIRKYEGQMPGDLIDIKIRIPFIRHWTLIIKETWQSEKEYGFAERGLRTPFGITYWHHTHRVVTRNETSSFIIDDIEFETTSSVINYMLYLPLYAVFYYRKIMYSKYFKKPDLR